MGLARTALFALAALAAVTVLAGDSAVAPELPPVGALSVPVSGGQAGWATFVTLDVDARDLPPHVGRGA